MSLRGVSKPGVTTATSALHGLVVRRPAHTRRVPRSRTRRAMTLTGSPRELRGRGLRLEDDVIRERFAAGDEQALEECQSRFGPLLLAHARRYVGPNDAEDVVQTVMIDAWRGRGRYDPSRPLEAWFLTIVRRRAIDLVRKQKTAAVDLDAVVELSGKDGRETAERFVGAVECAPSAGRASQGAARGARARLLRRAVTERGGESRRHPAGHDQDANGARLAAPGRPDGSRRVRVSAVVDQRPTRGGHYPEGDALVSPSGCWP